MTMSRSPVIPFSLFALVLVVLWFGVWGFFGNVQETRARLSMLNREIEAEEEARATLEELSREIEERRDVVDELDRAVPPERDTASLIAIFEEAASVNGLVLEGLSMNEQERERERINVPQVTESEDGTGVARGPSYHSFQASLDIKGNYRSFRNFLFDLERSFPLMDVSQVSFAHEQGEAISLSDPTIDFSLILTSYYAATGTE
jgi:hypothetical protein